MNREMFDMLDGIMVYLYDRVPHAISKGNILQGVFKDDPSVPIEALLLHLETEGYVFLPSYSNCYTLSVRGIEFVSNASSPENHIALSKNKRYRPYSIQRLRPNLRKKPIGQNNIGSRLR